MDVSDAGRSREPWNKGKLFGRNAPLKVKDIWVIRVRPQVQGRTAISLCLIQASTASCEVAISSSFASEMSVAPIAYPRGR